MFVKSKMTVYSLDHCDADSGWIIPFPWPIFG